ncbi:MAG: ArgE/DapE family deacylase [Chloroflexota bacterium]
MIDRQYLELVLSNLVQIDSTNPSLSPHGAGEAEIARYATELMEELGMTVTQHEPVPGRVSVVGRLTGSGGGRSLMLNAHMDTVAVEGMAEPFSGAIRDGRLYGRGSQDMKGSLAAQLAAVVALKEAGVQLKGDLFIAGVADEEFASIGVQSILKDFQPDGVIVTEPSDLQISLAHKGFIWIEIKTQGRAFHGSRPDMGIDANMMMGRVLGELEQLSNELAGRDPHPLLGQPSCHAAVIQGGTEWSVYSASSTLQLERRTLPGETPESVSAEIEGILKKLHADDSAFKASFRIELVRDPFEVDPEIDLVKILTDVSGEVLGTPAPHSGQTFWTDAAFHAASGSDTVLIGPIGDGLHSAEEWVDVDSVVKLAEILSKTAIQYCN